MWTIIVLDWNIAMQAVGEKFTTCVVPRPLPLSVYVYIIIIIKWGRGLEPGTSLYRDQSIIALSTANFCLWTIANKAKLMLLKFMTALPTLNVNIMLHTGTCDVCAKFHGLIRFGTCACGRMSQQSSIYFPMCQCKSWNCNWWLG